MFRNKVDVDRHVAKTLAKGKSERDRNFRAYSFGRLYYDVGDFESCIKYVEMYLSVKDNNPAAHTLLGQAYQKLGQAERALAAYKTSLALDPNQNNLILKVCELLGSEDFPLEAGSARYWSERAASAFPDHPALYALRARLLSAEGAGAPATAALLRAETAARPADPAPHARLLRHLLQSSSTQEAFTYAFQTNFSTDRFADSIVWNEAVSEILSQMTGADNLGWEFWLLQLTVSERLAELSLAEGRRPAEAASAIWKFDRTLFNAAENVIGVAPTRTLGAETLSHFGAQFCLHMATLLLKKAGREAGEWRESVRASAPLLLLALQPPVPARAPPSPQPTSPPASSERLLSSWFVTAACRRSQAGHTLWACAKDKKNVFLEKISQYCSGAHWRDKLYRKVFTSRDHLEKMSASFLLTNSNFAEVSISLPRSQDLKQTDQIAALLRPASLHHQAWLGSNAKNLSDVNCVGMDELRFSVNNLSNCGAETLNKLDLDTFLYCTIFAARKNVESEYKSGYWDSDRPRVLPAILTPPLCTPAQGKWWEAACQVRGAARGDLSDIRLTLTRGIETVRCVGSHGLDPELLVEVARAFSRRAEETTDHAQRRFLEARASLCYSAGVPLLERIRNNIFIRPPEKRLFEYTYGELPQEKLETLIEEGKLYLAVQCMNEKDDDKAIEILETVKSPYASFHLYKIYKRLADEITSEKERSDPAKRTRRALYLSKAREFVYLTTDRLKALRAESEHPLYMELGDHIQNIELSISRIEPVDRTFADENTYSSDEESWPGSAVGMRNSSLVALTPRSGRSRRITRRAEPQPSPESLEAQIRQLQRKNSVMTAFVEQTKVLVESNRTLVDEVREMKKALGEIRSHNMEDTVDQFKSLKLSVDEVKMKINEYRDESAADVADLKREITDLKNELGKIKSSPVVDRPQIDDNELFMLEEEAGAYFQRQQPAPVIPPQPYPIYPPGALYPLYGQYPGVPQLFPGALFQDQPLYSELLAQRSLPAPQPVQPQTVPFPAPAPIIAEPPVVTPQRVPPAIIARPPVHDYHIPLPQRTTAFPTATTTSTSTPNKPFGNLQTEPSNASKPFSLFDSPKPLTAEATKSFSFLGSPGTFNASQTQTSLNKSRTLSERSTDSYDPIPDFQPIINLPDEVAVMTGEEDEEVLFDARAKLFRFVAKEWKERGLGHIKLLKNRSTGKVRVLMRRERVHTICANHFITPEIVISPMKDREKAYFWGANDFADEIVQYEMFCIRFKTIDTGNEFFEKFCIAVEESSALKSSENTPVKDTRKPDSRAEANNEVSDSAEISVGGLKFFSTPTFKTVPDTPASAPSVPEAVKPNPFAGFTFNKNASISAANAFSPAKPAEPSKTESSQIKTGSGSTGSPNEVVIFETTAKVSMTDKNAMFYKEKGSGKIKICHAKDDGQNVRLKAIQEFGGAVWCDIQLTKELKYDELMLQPNTLIWSTPDVVSVRITFPSADVYQRFKAVSSETQSKLSEITKKPEKKKQPEKVPVKSEPVIPATVAGWGDKFKPKAGSWDCKSCYINNAGTTDYCVACDSPKDPSMPKKESKPAGGLKSHTFTFGIPPANGVSAIAPSSNVPASQTSIFGGLAQAPPKTTTFTFGIPATLEKPAENKETHNKSVSFADIALSTSKDTPNKNAPVADVTSATQSLTFGFPQKNTFEFSLKPKSPAKDKDQSVDKSHDSDNEYAAEDDGDHITFTPIIPLPDKVEVKTGEEEEEVVYKHLAKLYRFASGEWKECGVGDIKILKHPDTGKLRVLMRREPIHKICLNHALIADIKYSPKDEKTWLFSANDFSSGEIVPTQFCVRFKTPDIAKDFMSAIDKARAGLVTADSVSSDKPVAKSPSDDEVVFVTESKVTDEEKELAKKLMLPENFFAYKQKVPCKGCIGCNPDDYVFATPKPETKTEQKEDKKTDKKEEPIKPETKPAPASNAFIFGQKPSVIPTANITTVSSVFSTPSSVFGGSSIFSGKGESVSMFSGKQPDGDKKTPIIAVPKFTPSTEQPSAASIFGGQPLFSSNVFSAGSASIFGNAPIKTEEPKAPGLTSGVIAAPTFSFNTNPESGSIFGGTKDSSSVFKVPNPVTSTPTQASVLFGNAANSQQSLFSSSTFSAQPSGGSIFGGKGFGVGASDPAKPGLVFGQGNNTTIFGGTPTTVSELVNKNVEPSAVGENGEKESPSSQPAVVLKLGLNPDLSFSSLAAKNAEVPLKPKEEEKSTEKSFNWAGAGTPLFRAGKPRPPPQEGHDESHEDGHEADTEYDPHYEPVVPMPDEINVVTGEEDEVVKFEQKAKLFRFVNTEWKERGIGNFRLLYHPERRTYRLLMRQSQVHKVVLNQLITKDLQLMPMSKSERAFMWAGINYTEDCPGGEPEKLAVRFTNQEQARTFSNRVQEVLKELEERPELKVSKEEEEEVDEGKHSEDQQEEEHETDEEDDEDDPYARDNMHMMFESPADMRGASVYVALVSTGDGGYLRVYDGKELVSETYVTEGATMERDGLNCRWWGVGETPEEAESVDMPEYETAAELQEYFYDLINYK